MTIGIYSLYWEDNNLTYIGQSISIERRVQTHIGLLCSGTHTNCKLQDTYNLYGKPSYSILEVCLSTELDLKEIFWIKEFDTFHNGLNLTLGGKSLGFGEDNPNSKYKREEYIQVLKLSANTTLTIEDISKKVGVTVSVVKDIQRGHNHSYLETEFPEEYLKMKSKLYNRSSAKCQGICYETIISPEGIEYNIDNVRVFAKTHDINQGNLNSVLNKRRKSVQGWKLKERS